MDEQENEQATTEQPEKKRRGRPSKIIQSGVTIIDTPQNVEVEEQGTVFAEEPKRKRGRKPKEQLNINGPSDETIKKSIQSSLKQKARMIKKVIKKKRGRKKIVRRKKAINIFDVIKPSFKTFKMPKIKINLSGIKLPKGLTWHDVQIWSVAMAAIIAIALAK
jgi:hypothetical protein